MTSCAGPGLLSSDREVQFKSPAESFSPPCDRRDDGNDNGVVERWVLNDHGDMTRENHLFDNEASAETFACVEPHRETVKY